ncbi:MAG: ABC transporter substrate-binding protein [Chloroflexota bacterium]
MHDRYRKLFERLTREQKKLVDDEYNRAYDFDPKDPLFGLSKSEISGPTLSRRTVLRLLAASGVALSAGPLMKAAGLVPESTVRRAAAQDGPLEITAGWAGTADIATLDPAQINQVLQFQVASNVLSGLTHINPDLVAEGDLAVDWTVSDDGLEWTFNLREGVTFHNGDPFTSADVLYTYNRSNDPEQSIQVGTLANIAEVNAVDDFTVQIVLAQPQASLLVKTLERASGRAMTIVNQRALEENGPADYGLIPIGTGPFRVTEHQLGQGVVLEKFEDYYDPQRPILDKVTIIPIPEPEPLAAALETGDIQITGGNPLAAELIDRFLANPELVVSEIAGPGFQTMFINPWREPFEVPDFNKSVEELKQEPGFMVRLALAKAFDRDLFINRALFGRGRPAFGTINPAMGFFFDTAINETSEQTFDLEAARQLLADAGFPNGEGIRPLQLLTTPAGRREGEVIANMYAENLGITIELDIKDFTVLIEEQNSMNFDLCRLGSGGDFDPDDAILDWMVTTSRFNGPTRDTEMMPFGFFSDARVDELAAEQATIADPEARRALVQEANQITSDKVATVFVFHPLDILVWREEINFPDESRIPGLVDLDRVSFN